jgi:hypothetical protein
MGSSVGTGRLLELGRISQAYIEALQQVGELSAQVTENLLKTQADIYRKAYEDAIQQASNLAGTQGQKGLAAEQKKILSQALKTAEKEFRQKQDALHAEENKKNQAAQKKLSQQLEKVQKS